MLSVILCALKPYDLASRCIASVTLIANISFQVYLAGYGDFQLDFHMFYFSMLAVCMVFLDWKVILVASAAIAGHHLSLNYLLPYAIFPEETDLSRVILHAVAVVIEAGVIGFFVYYIEKIFNRMSHSRGLVNDAIRNADLTLRFNTQGTDETADFSKSLNGFFDKMSVMMKTAKQSVDTVSRVSEQLKGSSDDLSSMSHTQEDNIKQLQEALRSTTEQIHEINEMAERTSNRTTNMSSETEKASTLMQGLEKSASRIGDVTNVVLQISEQINLLSLNASIEAARAGDAGRGFAVVAGEVKKLADETNESISQIKNVVSELNGMVSEASQAVAVIDESATEVGSDIQNVHSSLEQQNAATQEFMSTIELFTQQITQLNNAIQESQLLVKELDQASDDVTENIGQFKL